MQTAVVRLIKVQSGAAGATSTENELECTINLQEITMVSSTNRHLHNFGLEVHLHNSGLDGSLVLYNAIKQGLINAVHMFPRIYAHLANTVL